MPSLDQIRPPVDLNRTAAFLVADALSVGFSLLGRRRRLVSAQAIDERTKAIGLGIERAAIRAFL